MSLEKAIRTRWSGDDALTSLVPVTKLATGVALNDPARPYVTLHRGGSGSSLHTSSRRVDKIDVRFEVWTEDLDEGKNIADAVAARFDRQRFLLDGGGAVRMRRIGHEEHHDDQGVWRLSLHYTATAAQPTGA